MDMWVSLVSYKSDMDRAGWGRRDDVGAVIPRGWM